VRRRRRAAGGGREPDLVGRLAGLAADFGEDVVVEAVLALGVGLRLFGERELEPFLVEVRGRAREALDVVAGRGDEERRAFLRDDDRAADGGGFPDGAVGADRVVAVAVRVGRLRRVVDEDDREAFDVVAEPLERGVEVLDGAGVFDEVEVGEVVEAVEDDEAVAVLADLRLIGEVVGEREAGVEVERDAEVAAGELVRGRVRLDPLQLLRA
jgi:hypothetical protein